MLYLKRSGTSEVTREVNMHFGHRIEKCTPRLLWRWGWGLTKDEVIWGVFALQNGLATYFDGRYLQKGVQISGKLPAWFLLVSYSGKQKKKGKRRKENEICYPDIVNTRCVILLWKVCYWHHCWEMIRSLFSHHGRKGIVKLYSSFFHLK